MGDGDATVSTLRETLAEAIARQVPNEGDLLGAVPGLQLFRRHTPALGACQVYEPALAVVAQGEKRIEIGSETVCYDEANWLLTPLHFPALSRITRASEQRPFLACVMLLDMQIAREMVATLEPLTDAEGGEGLAVRTGPISVELLDAALRLVRLNEKAWEIPVLAGLLQREILYRLLTSPSGRALRRVVTADSQSHRVARAVAWIRSHFREPLRMEELATHARMGVSTLHHHFRDLTGNSPLQFQKQLRLFEARRLMLIDGMDAASAAYATGYESATQFNREYRRQFGQPPRRDVMGLQTAELVTIGN